MNRRIVNRIEPHGAQSFDQQFWPVVIALCVLCGIAFGAALTLMRGPWLWWTLLLTAFSTAGAVYLLHRLDNTKLRRSLQLGLIISLAAHLLILIWASVISIFNNEYHFDKPRVASRRNKVVQINNHRTPMVFEESRQQQMPDPTVEVERETTTSEVQPQPVPVEQTEPRVNPQLVRREEQVSQSVPHMDRDLSQMHRQERNLTPKSSLQAQAAPAAREQETRPRDSQPGEQVSVARSASESRADRAGSERKPLEQTPVQANDSRIARRNASATPETNSRDPDPSLQSQATRRDRNVEIPMARPTRTLPEIVSTPAEQVEADSRPSKAAKQMTRRAAVSQTGRPSEFEHPKTETSPTTQISRASAEPTQQTQPAISHTDATAVQPRRSSNNQPAPTTTIAVEAPSRAPESTAQTNELHAKTLSVERGEAGVSGAGSSSNLDRDLGGAPSPAVQASDSAVRRQSESREAQTPMLTATQRSETRRSVAEALRPKSAFRADTTAPAKLSGSSTPVNESLESSAATVDSASAAHRSQVSAERGQSSADIGATRIVAGPTSRRQSGGGQPELTQLNPESTQRSNVDSSDRKPTLAADVVQVTGAPSSATSAPQSASESQPEATPVALAREGGTSAVTLERSATVDPGSRSDQGDARLTDQLAGSRQRAESDSRVDSGRFEEESRDQHQGNMDTRLSKAPLIRQSDQIGNEMFSGGVRDNEEDSTGDAIASTVVERSAGSLAGTLSRATSSQLIGAAAAMPLVDFGPSNSERKRRDLDDTGSSNAVNGEALETVSPANNRAPEIRQVNLEAFATVDGEGTSPDALEASQVSVDRAGSRTSTQGAALEIDAELGPAGLGEVTTANLGIRERPATGDSTMIQPDSESRFRTDRFGGNLAVNPDAVIAKRAFMDRQPAGQSSGEPTNERAIQLGLEFLARHQATDGKWALTGFDQEHPNYQNQLDCDTAATGLALLAFQGAGYNHREFKYARQMKHAIDWLVRNQSGNGSLFVETGTPADKSCRLYSHGIAALALTEAYGMTQDPDLREPAQRALDFIMDTQDPEHGGWRYYSRQELRQTDTSVTGWMMMALKSGQLAGLETREETFDGISEWLETAADPGNASRFSYNPYAQDSATKSREKGRQSTPPMTSVGLLMQIYNGWDRTDPKLAAGVNSLVQDQLPGDTTVLMRDTYYWYYATQVLLHVGGEPREQWHDALHPLLVDSQVTESDMAGSWHPYEPVPDRWGVHAGRLYVTAMNLLSLEVHNRKLPIYDETAK